MKTTDNSIQPFIPAEWIDKVMRYWWLLVLAGVLGGALGAGIHAFLPPVYQAQAVITSGVDFSYTGDLTDVEEDYMIQAVGGVIGSDEVSEAAFQAVKAAGLDIDRQSFDEALSLQRRFVDWLLVVRHTDAQTAVDISNMWADAAWAALEETNGHVLELGAMQDYQDALMGCLALQETSEDEQAVCAASSLEEVQTELERVQAIIEVEKSASNGMVPGTVISFTQYAALPDSPAMLGRNSLALAGALIGLLLGLAGLLIRRR